MKCDKCPKKATVHLTEIVDGKVMEMHLCEDCARDQSQHMEQQFGLADLLAGLTDFGKHVPDTQKEVVLLCPACGLSYEDFRKFGRFGCAECYTAFNPHLKTLLKKIHGSTAHLGKKLATVEPATPVSEKGGVLAVKAPAADSMESLRARMHRAIDDEDFELAATLRDKIRELEQRD